MQVVFNLRAWKIVHLSKTTSALVSGFSLAFFSPYLSKLNFGFFFGGSLFSGFLGF